MSVVSSGGVHRHLRLAMHVGVVIDDSVLGTLLWSDDVVPRILAGRLSNLNTGDGCVRER